MKEKKLSILIMDLVIVVLGICFAGTVVFAVKSFQEAFAPWYNTENLFYAVESGDYDNLLPYYYQQKALGMEPDERDKEYLAVAEYFDAAVYRIICEKTGSAKEAEKYMQVMEAAYGNMGDFSFAKDKIDEKLLKFSTKSLPE